MLKLPKRSALKQKKEKENIRKAFAKEISFESPADINISLRDYGFMRVTSDKRATPYPRVEVGIDPKLLKARLQVENMRVTSKHKVDITPTSDSKARMVAIGALSPKRNDYFIGTPHPSKSLAVDPRRLIKKLSHITPDYIDSDNPPSPTITFNTEADFAKVLEKRKQRTPKGLLTPTPSLVRRVCVSQIVEDMDDMIGKPGSLFPQQSNITSESVHLFGMRDEDQDSNQDFYERRRLFYEAEYTIAKFGKKMSDYVMAPPKQSLEFEETQGWLNNAQKAKTEIEIYMQKMGLKRTENNNLANIRSILRNQSDNEDEDDVPDE